MFYRADQALPLTGLQVDANNRELFGLAVAPPHVHVPSPQAVARPYLYSNMVGTRAAISTITMSTSNALRLWPFIPTVSFTPSQLRYYKAGSHTTNLYRFAIHTSDTHGFPTSRIWETFGANSLSTVGTDFNSISVPFEGGKVYWLGVCSSNTGGGTLRAVEVPLGRIHWDISGTTEYAPFGIRVTATYDNFPANISFTNWATNTETVSVMPAITLG